MAFEWTEEVAAKSALQFLGCVQEADAVDAARPWMRNVDGGRRTWRGRFAPVEEVDETEISPRPDVVQFVEWFVVTLVVGDEQLPRRIGRRANGETMAGGDGRKSKQMRIIKGGFAGRQTKDMAVK